MSERRSFRLAFLGSQMVILIAILSFETREIYENQIMIGLAVSIPFSALRTLISDHPLESRYKSVAGFSAWPSYLGVITTLYYLFKGHGLLALNCFVLSVSICLLMFIFGKSKS